MRNRNKGARETCATNSGICLAVLCQVDWNNHRKLQKAQESHLVSYSDVFRACTQSSVLFMNCM